MTKQYWDTISAEDRVSVLKHADVGFGVVLNRDEGWNVAMGKKLLELDAGAFEVLYPTKTGIHATEIFETEAEFNLRKFGLEKVSANAGLSGTIEGITGGASGSMSHSTETETSTATKDTTYYLYAEYAAEMVTLDLKTDAPALTPEFERHLRKALDGTNKDVQKLAAVYDVMNTYGWYVPTSLTLGGKLIQTDTVATSSKTDKYRIKEEFEANFEASVGVPEVFDAKAGGGTESKHETETSSTHSSSHSNKRRTVVGGSVKGLGKEGLDPWLESLDNSQDWKVIAMQLHPTLAYMPADLMQQFRALYNGFGSYEAAKRAADLDVFAYMGEAELASESGLADDW